MAADHFCLRWNNHQSTLVSVFDDLLESETLVDCTLAADGKYLKAHKVVLSACSPYLGMILSQHYDQHPIIILKDVKYEEMKAMLDYMYRGEVNISQEHLATFLKAAESLQIKGLTDTSSLNEEANKKQLQVERPPSSAESTTSAPTNDETFSREGSCSPTPKKRKQEVLCKNNVESDENVKQVRAGITDVVSDLSVRNSVSSKFKLSSSDVAKNSVHVKSEPMDEPLYDGFMPSNVQGSEDGVKGIPRAGPSNGSNSSIVGSPWLMSVDSTGDEGKLGSEQDADGPKVTNVMSLYQPEDSYVSWLDCLTTTDVSEEMYSRYGSLKTGWHGQRFICLVCGKTYSMQASLYNHKKFECGREPNFICPYCPHRTKQKGNLKTHIKKRHPEHFSFQNPFCF